MGINGNMVYDGALLDIVGVHRGISKVNGLVKLCENSLEELVPPISITYDVGLTPTIAVGIKYVGRER